MMPVSLLRELCNLSEVQVKKQERTSERVELENGREEELPRGAARVQGPEVLLVNTIAVN